MVPDLDLYFKDYCNFWCEQRGGTCDRTSYLVPGYEQYRTTVTDVETMYISTPSEMFVPSLAGEETFINNTSVEQTQTLSESRTTTNTFTWTLQEGFRFGIEVKFDVGVPPIASAETKVTAEINASSTQSHTTTTSRTWTISQVIVIPARTRVEASVFIDFRNFSQPFITKCTFGGYVASMSPNPIQGHYFWFHRVDGIFTQFPLQNFTVSGEQVLYQGSGEFTGLMGARIRIRLDEFPLDSNSNEPSKTYEIINPVNCAGVADMADYYSQIPCLDCMCPCLPPRTGLPESDLIEDTKLEKSVFTQDTGIEEDNDSPHRFSRRIRYVNNGRLHNN